MVKKIVKQNPASPKRDWVLTKKTRLTIAFIASVIFLTSCFFIVRTMLAQEGMEEENVLYKYSISADSSYTVKLIPNELYPSGELEEGNVYSQRLFDKMQLELSADYAGSLPAEISGDYSVKVIVRGFQGSNESKISVYEKSFSIIATRKINTDGNTAAIKDSAAVTLTPYKEFADNAEIILGSKVGREMEIVFSGTFIADTEHGKIEEPFSHIISVPINSDLFTISKQAPFQTAGDISEPSPNSLTLSPAQIIPPGVVALAALLFLCIVLFKARKPTEKEMHSMELKTLLRKYGSRMVKLKALPIFEGENALRVFNMESLVRLSDELQHPICFFPDSKGAPVNGVLYVPFKDKYYVLYLHLNEPIPL